MINVFAILFLRVVPVKCMLVGPLCTCIVTVLSPVSTLPRFVYRQSLYNHFGMKGLLRFKILDMGLVSGWLEKSEVKEILAYMTNIASNNILMVLFSIDKRPKPIRTY
jgi:hypothetical protein